MISLLLSLSLWTTTALEGSHLSYCTYDLLYHLSALPVISMSAGEGCRALFVDYCSISVARMSQSLLLLTTAVPVTPLILSITSLSSPPMSYESINALCDLEPIGPF